LGRQKTGRLDSIDHSPAWSARARLLAAEPGVGRAEFHVFALRLRRYPGLPCVFYAILDASIGVGVPGTSCSWTAPVTKSGVTAPCPRCSTTSRPLGSWSSTTATRLT
jgi:hypothetical protein